MIKIPDEISILHVKYKVIQVPVIDKGEGDGFILGKVNFTNNTIQIDQGLCDTLKLQTLIHEIMHAVFFQTGQSEAQNNEAVCQAAAAGLMSVIQENDLKEEGSTQSWKDEEHKESILDDAEREYLSAVIKPFRDRVIGICKTGFTSIGERKYQYVFITLCDRSYNIDLPLFEKETMYKGMKLDIAYLPEELGL